jgi:hypothetical protein
MCGARSCTVVLCHIRTEISVKLFDRGTVWEVMYVGLGNLASFDYRNHMFWKWPLCPPSGVVNVRYVHWGHLVELLSYPDRVIHSTSCPPKDGKSSFQDHCVVSHQRIITFSQLAALFFFLLRHLIETQTSWSSCVLRWVWPAIFLSHILTLLWESRIVGWRAVLLTAAG